MSCKCSVQQRPCSIQHRSVLGEPVDFKVGEAQSVLLRLENPGNGEDTFILTGAVLADPNITPQPEVEFTIYNPERTLGPLATTIATVDVVLDEDTPALNPFQLQFTWTSQGEGNIAAVTALTVQAEPDYRWELMTSMSRQLKWHQGMK